MISFNSNWAASLDGLLFLALLTIWKASNRHWCSGRQRSGQVWRDISFRFLETLIIRVFFEIPCCKPTPIVPAAQLALALFIVVVIGTMAVRILYRLTQFKSCPKESSMISNCHVEVWFVVSVRRNFCTRSGCRTSFSVCCIEMVDNI